MNILLVVFFIFQFSILTLLSRPFKVLSQSIIFEDNFNNIQNGDLPQKWVVDGQNGWSVQNGEFGIHLNPGVSNAVIRNEYWNKSLNNYVFEVDLKGVLGTDKNIVFHYLDDSNRYEIHHTGGLIYLEKYTSSSQYGDSIAAPVPLFLENNIKYHFKLIVSGDHITLYISNNLIFDVYDNKNPKIIGGKVGLRVGTGATSPTEVWYDNVVVTALPDTNPTPTPTPSSTPIPVTKTVFVPGFGGSWNTDAIINCKSESNPEDWSLAPFAQDYYTPILTVLNDSGWNVKPFYYDWRRNVPYSANLLSDFIDNFSFQSEEKINLVGHSMGGLLSRAYLSQFGTLKVNKIMTAGSPHLGDAIAYPSWSGGDIWNGNLLQRIALTLYLKRCGGLFSSDRQTIQTQIPSVRDLLPDYNFLVNFQDRNQAPYQTIFAKNNWLDTNPMFDLSNITAQTLTGTGLETLNFIPVKPASKNDYKMGNWDDGKPTGKITTTEGDGTVLSISSRLPGIEDVTINQSHSGLVRSVEGMAEILKFLGSTPPENFKTDSTEPKSALVIIGYPANFWVMNNQGQLKKDEDGVISFINPKSGSYKIGLLPKNKDILLIVAQFLPNGQNLYREYNFTGTTPTIKSLIFNSEAPNEDILN